jgi:hypothetical protein
MNFDERYVAQCFINPVIGLTFRRPAQKYTDRFRVIAPRMHLKMPQKSVTCHSHNGFRASPAKKI